MNQLELREKGMSLAAKANEQWLQLARGIALRIAKDKGSCSIEDVRGAWPYPVFPTGNWCGSIFRGLFEVCGFEMANHEGGHSRRVLRWKLKLNPAKNPDSRRVVTAPTVTTPTTDLFGFSQNDY